jgi:hypothetical protein
MIKLLQFKTVHTFLTFFQKGFLVDKFGKYKPVVILTLLLNAVFHHALFIIPQQEIPGQMPSAFVFRHPNTGNIEVWWSPCPSRECPQEEEIDIVVNYCQDYCLLLEKNPKIEPLLRSPTNKYQITRNDGLKDLNLERKRGSDANMTLPADYFAVGSDDSFTENSMKFAVDNSTGENQSYFERENIKESWVSDGMKF